MTSRHLFFRTVFITLQHPTKFNTITIPPKQLSKRYSPNKRRERRKRVVILESKREILWNTEVGKQSLNNGSKHIGHSNIAALCACPSTSDKSEWIELVNYVYKHQSDAQLL